MAEGNRKDPRARVLNMTVRYKSATVDEFIENHSHDISRGGMFIKTRSPFPAGTLLKFEVRIAEDQKLMQGVGRVVWRRDPERADEGFPAGMGIKFIKIGEGAAELIAQIVAARQGQESSFEAGARENGETGSGRRSVAPSSGVEAAAATPRPSSDGPALQVESDPPSQPVDGETRVSAPAKKRQGQPEETRKVVLQPSAFDAATPGKTSLPALEPKPVAATAPDERAPNRPAASKKRGSIVDETTTPRARVPSAAPPKQSSPSLYGLVGILGLVGATVWFVNRSREPEPENTPATPKAVTATAEPGVSPSAPTAPTPPPAPSPPAAPAAADTNAAPATNAAAAAAPPQATAEATPDAPKQAPAGATGADAPPPGHAAPPARISPGAEEEPIANAQALPAPQEARQPPVVNAKPAPSPVPTAQKPAPSTPPASNVAKSAAAGAPSAPAKAPPAPAKPAVPAKPPVHATPSGEPIVPKPVASGAANAGHAPSERAPAAAADAPEAKKPSPAPAPPAPSEAAPAPKAPSDDNPY